MTGQQRLLLQDRRGAREARRRGARVHRQPREEGDRAEAPALQRHRQELRDDQPEGHRPAVPGHARQGGHPRAQTSQTPEHGETEPGVRRRGHELAGRRAGGSAGLRRPRLRARSRTYLERGIVGYYFFFYFNGFSGAWSMYKLQKNPFVKLLTG